MFEEVPLPSIPTLPSSNDLSEETTPDYLNYFSLLESYHPEYFDDLPSEIMNHFRTSTPRPFYEDPPADDLMPPVSSPGPLMTCLDNNFLSPCNPQLPRFSLSDLSRLSLMSMPGGHKMVKTVHREPTQLLPPSGRVPYPTFRPDYQDVRNGVTPLMFTPRHYVPSSTIRPINNQTWIEMDRSNTLVMRTKPPKITTYRPNFSLTTSKQNKDIPSYKDESIQRMKDRLAEIIRRLKEKDKMEEKQIKNQRRKNGQRYYPHNNINPHLPVTSHPSSSTPAPNPDDYFTVKDRSMNGCDQQLSGGWWCLLLCALIILQQYH